MSETVKAASIVSGQIRLQLPQYVGIINGIAYRFDINKDASGKLSDLVPLDVQPAAVGGSFGTSMDALWLSDSRGVRPASEEKSSEKAPLQEEESIVRFFAREGAEPLRAGHPDLWRLLVEGTCLEGSTFRTI